MFGWIDAIRALEQVAAVAAPRAAAGGEGGGGASWLADPRSAVLLTLGAVIVLGGGRRLLQAWRAGKAVERLADPSATPEEVEAAAAHGRAGLMPLFEILGTPERPAAVRDAAGRALAAIWKQDELIAEEEQALVRRGFVANWRARRRYPRSLKGPIPIAVDYGVPFLVDLGPGVGPSELEWSHRILGADRAGLETFTTWTPGAGRAEFALEPGDLAGDGPHRLVLHARVRTGRGLTGPWEIELPQMPFTFEFDRHLEVGALLGAEDDARAEFFAAAVRLESPPSDPGGGSTYLDLDPEFALRDPPEIVVQTPLPADLSHRVEIEIDGVEGRHPAGSVVVHGQGTGRAEPGSSVRIPLRPIGPFPPGSFDRPGERPLRVILTAEPDRGWADPAVRSIWPGTITTAWTTARVVRR